MHTIYQELNFTYIPYASNIYFELYQDRTNTTSYFVKTYYNGEVKNTQKWDKKGKRIVESKLPLNKEKVPTIVSDWPEDVKTKMLNDCMAAQEATREICQCMVDQAVSEFSYQESQLLETLKEEDIPEDLKKRAIELMTKLMECYK